MMSKWNNISKRAASITFLYTQDEGINYTIEHGVKNKNNVNNDNTKITFN